MKVCIECGVEKPLTDFRRRSSSKDGRVARCTECMKLAYKNKYRKAEGYQEKARDGYVRWKYGITWEDVLSMYKSQDGKCAICNRDIRLDSGGVKNHPDIYCIDHCHETGKVRGLLCHDCNRGLGLFRDSIPNLSKAVEYLEGTKC